MPEICRFKGIIIRMYYQLSEHNPPHLHVVHGSNEAVVSIEDGNIIDGLLPARVLSTVRKWIHIHNDELLDMWKTQEFRKLPPL